jgi:hypothetical protein
MDFFDIPRYLYNCSKTAKESRDIVMSSTKIENVLVLQGGGSLGAFACGVFKALANKNIKVDIVAGTSIGGINAAIIAGSVDKEHPERTLEEFWLELAETSHCSISIKSVSCQCKRCFKPCTTRATCNYHNLLIG